MPAYNFKDRFAPLVEKGLKRTTIRRKRKRPTKPGDDLHLYSGLRTKTARLLRPVEICLKVQDFRIEPNPTPETGDSGLPFVFLSNRQLDVEESNRIARGDGFTDAKDLVKFFETEYGLPFCDAELISW